MSLLASEAELVKLARALDVEPPALDFLEGIAAADLRALRAAVNELAFDQDRVLFERLATLVGPLPTRLTALLAQRAGPLLTARVAGEMAPLRAAAVAARLPAVFRAHVAAELDPRRAAGLVRSLPVESVLEVALELAARGDHVTLSRFVDVLPEQTIVACMEAIDDEATLLLIAYFMSSKERLGHLFALAPPERRAQLVERVAEQPGALGRPLAALMAHGGEPLRTELAALAATLLERDDATRVAAAVAAELD